MMKNFTLLLLLASMMIPMTLYAQTVKKDVLTDGTLLKGNSSLLKKNVTAPADKRVQKLSNSTKSLHRAPKAAPSADAITWDFEGESDFNQFTRIDGDGDGFNWEYHYNNDGVSTMTTHEGSGLVFSASYNKDKGESLFPDNWLISPEVTFGGVLSFWACGQQEQFDYEEVFGVFVCVGSSTNPDDFVQVGADITTTDVMTLYDFDLSQYAGQTGRFAIRHYHCSDKFYLNIDDICLDVNATYIPEPTNPTNLVVNPAATTANVTWDGAEGDTWNLRYKVNNPNETLSFLWDLTVENYQSQAEDWTIEDRDDDGYNWGLAYSNFDPTGTLDEEENVCFYSYSWRSTEGLKPDNWLISPELPLGGIFKFWAINGSESYPDDKLGVFVIIDEGNIKIEQQIGEDFTASPYRWNEYSFDTSEYDGKMGKIAIRHYKTDNQFDVYVDYISYEKPGDEPAPWIEVNGLTSPNYTIEGLEPGTDYRVEVQAYTEKGETEWTEPTYFTTGIAVSVSAVGHATLYYGDKNLVVPDGVEASAVTVEGRSITKSQVYASGDIIPQGTGVLLQAQQGEYIFGVTSDEGTAAADNMLRGSDKAEETTGGDIYYMLSLNSKSEPGSVGFYYGAADGAPFTNGAHKAYLALTTEQAANTNRVWFDTTAISTVEAAKTNSTDVYTVTGVQVNSLSRLPKGIYIIGGKKTVVK